MSQVVEAVPDLELGFYLLGDLPEPWELERLFIVRAFVSNRAGESRLHRKSGQETGVHLQSLWGFTSRHIVSNEMQPHLTWLLETAAPARKLLDSRPNSAAFIEVALFNGSSTVLPRPLIEFAEELKAEIGFVARSGHAA